MQIIIHFKKKGLMRYLSAIESANAVIRVLNRSGLEMQFSEGFHPSPKVSFLDSTPTGMIDLAMYVSVKLRNEITEFDSLKFLEKLKILSPKGIEPTKVFKSEVNLNKVVDAYEYLLFCEKELFLSEPVLKHSGKTFIPAEVMKNLEVVLKRNIFVIKYTIDREKLFNPFLLEGTFLAVRKKALSKGEDVSKILEGQEHESFSCR